MAGPFPAIEVTGLSKRYSPPQAGLLAVDHVDFEVRRGEVFGFLGPNGAGKTTTIRMLTGLVRPTAGQASVLGLDLGRDLPRIKKRIGVVPEASNLYNELTTFGNLVFSMQLYGVPRRERTCRADELLERFRLADKRDVPFARLSREMKRARRLPQRWPTIPRSCFWTNRRPAWTWSARVVCDRQLPDCASKG
jgi:ABC-2 type transport system ATP-binding protein